MSCIICSLKNIALQNEIERLLDINQGVLTNENKKHLKETYPDEAETIDSITDQESTVHWNFHQQSSYVPTVVEQTDETKKKSHSLRDDIGKSEAVILSDIVAKQMETFNRLTRKINKAIDDEESDIKGVIVNPITVDFYKELTSSMRSSIKEMRELNQTVNGEANGSMEGLKAIAVAIAQPLGSKNIDGHEDDMTTHKFDY